jgi:hypothetical protein
MTFDDFQNRLALKGYGWRWQYNSNRGLGGQTPFRFYTRTIRVYIFFIVM